MRQALLGLLLQLQLDFGFSLLLKRVRVPGLVWSGRDAPLHCDYDTQGEDIYSVKWYKASVPSLKSKMNGTFKTR